MQLARTLKKNGISIDIVNFGEEVENLKVLSSFIEIVSHDNNRYFIFFLFRFFCFNVK